MTDRPPLSEREIEILRLVATGASNKEIAAKLVISSNTVKVHLRNIFAKTGVVSRTEAALYAIREGMVQVEGSPEPMLDVAGWPGAATFLAPLPAPDLKSRAFRRWWIGVVLLVPLLAIATLLSATREPRTIASASPVVPSAASRWQARAALPTSRMGAAAAMYENQIYVIGGSTGEAVSSISERYSPKEDAWTSLAPKPLPVADAGAAVIGGRIYVAGGRLASGELTNVLEVYDPRQDRWEQRAQLPTALGGYALAAFEGKLYLFGGWDGARAAASVYAYDPETDVWDARTPMLTARAYAGAAVSGNRIYVIGGYDGSKALAANEEYAPEVDGRSEGPWVERKALPVARYAMGVAAVAGIIHVVGGETEAKEPLIPLNYLPQQDKWQSFEQPLSSQWSHLALVSSDTQIYALGGSLDGVPTTRNFAYQAIYTIIVPAFR